MSVYEGDWSRIGLGRLLQNIDQMGLSEKNHNGGHRGLSRSEANIEAVEQLVMSRREYSRSTQNNQRNCQRYWNTPEFCPSYYAQGSEPKVPEEEACAGADSS